MQLEGKVIGRLRDWANQNDSVRAVVLTSSRAQPNSHTDVFSDYDVELYVNDIRQFMNDEWLASFGDVMIRWPFKPMPTFSNDWITRLVRFKNGVRIDFQITTRESIESSAYDDGYIVLVDKDGLTGDLDEATFAKHLIKKPTREEYEALVNGFFWEATYVAKYLWRDELYFAKYILDSAMRFEYLRGMIEWHIGEKHNWSINTGIQGRFFKRYLDSSTWAELEATFTDAGIENNWQALFNMPSLFRRLAAELAERLGYEYPGEMDQMVTDYCNKTRMLERE